MILITSMGGCASTSFIGWSSKKIKCNCPLNSEGIAKAGPGSNPRGLKHRIAPPRQSDEYLLRRNSYNRTDLTVGPITRAVFLYDTPYSMVLSLFRRKIAMGHAMAVTGKKPPHGNDLSRFLDAGHDTFGFFDQFENWSNPKFVVGYPRLLVNFDSLWDNLDYILGYMGIDNKYKNSFLRKNERVNRMGELTMDDKQKLRNIYAPLETSMNRLSGLELIV